MCCAAFEFKGETSIDRQETSSDGTAADPGDGSVDARATFPDAGAAAKACWQGVLVDSLLDALPDQTAVVDTDGCIVFANHAWYQFGRSNGIDAAFDWVGVNYLRSCRLAAEAGDVDASVALNGLHEVLIGHADAFHFEYPCHGPAGPRWFMMRIVPLGTGLEHLFVVSHIDVTRHKLAELQASELAHTDPLTRIGNRRRFDDFAAVEWARCVRSRKPFSLVLIDIDHFKTINDRFGHATGDLCLTQVARLIDGFARRPGDLAARYGGEEFALVLGDTPAADALRLAESVREGVAGLPVRVRGTRVPLTVSAGVSTRTPAPSDRLADLFDRADAALYDAKTAGRNGCRSR